MKFIKMCLFDLLVGLNFEIDLYELYYLKEYLVKAMFLTFTTQAIMLM